jgi:Asp-tRNA(Asn)/Glu-tRNA(Gln) amidotransferase A subunit family amidase
MTSALKMADMVRRGETNAETLVNDALKLIDRTDSKLKAWAHIDPKGAIARAKLLDEMRDSGRALGKLHGVPIGIKDIINTADMPTEFGSVAFYENQPSQDAIIVSRMKEAGAVILGKTVTTPFAFMDPSETRNPHNTEYSPGGSSSGSAAAVSAGHVPVAIGTQTNGSVIRPASFCGVYGFKPSLGMVPRSGVLQTSETLDQVGVFARHYEDVALISDIISEYDPNDMNSFCRPRPNMLDGVCNRPPKTPKLLWFEMPYLRGLSEECRDGMEKVIATLDGCVDKKGEQTFFEDFLKAQRVIHHYEIARNLSIVRQKSPKLLSLQLCKALDMGSSIDPEDYHRALAQKDDAISYFQDFFVTGDAIIAPSSLGEAPLFSDGSTGNPVCSTIWTLCGFPCLTIPALVSKSNMPIGVQLIGEPECDDKLLGIGGWLLEKLNNHEQ